MEGLPENQKDMVKFKKTVREAYRFFSKDNTRGHSDLFLWIKACAYSSAKHSAAKKA